MGTQPHLSVYTTLKVVPWMAGLRSCDRDCVACKAEIISDLALPGKGLMILAVRG